MPDRRAPLRADAPPLRVLAPLLLAILLLGACVFASPTPSATPASVSPAATGTPTPRPSATPTSPPTATPEPPLSLALPDQRDAREVEVRVAPAVDDAGGRITVTVTSRSDEMIDELVLRWPTELRTTLFLSPFAPSEGRIREGGAPLIQPWTRWVDGPGEQGEPAGTTSLGYGPLLAGATLEIPLVVTRNAAGPVAFDLQLLAGEAILELPDGAPAALRVEVP